MLTVPKDLTAYQGIDAFCHATEGYLSILNQPPADYYALDAVRLIAQHLPSVVKDGSNLEARTAVAWANTAAGMVESLSSCISHHSMEHDLSAYHPSLPHGAGLALLSVSYFSFMASKVPDRFGALAEAMGENISNLNSKEEKAAAFITALKKLLKGAGLDELHLSSFGISIDECEKFAKNAFDNMGGLFQLDPYKLSFEEVVSIYRNCF